MASSAATAGLKLNPAIAKMMANGQINCLVCALQVKQKVWTAHVNGKKHRDNVERLKKQISEPVNQAKLKRPELSQDGPTEKRQKLEDIEQPVSSGGGLPSDFFESSSAVVQSGIPWQRGREKVEEAKPKQGVIENIPQGFFDDRRDEWTEDAIKKKEKMDAEYEKFMRELNAQNLDELKKQEEEEQREFLERDMETADEQLRIWEDAHKLELMIEEKAAKAVEKQNQEMESEDEDDEDLVLDLNNWRSKAFS